MLIPFDLVLGQSKPPLSVRNRLAFSLHSHCSSHLRNKRNEKQNKNTKRSNSSSGTNTSSHRCLVQKEKHFLVVKWMVSLLMSIVCVCVAVQAFAVVCSVGTRVESVLCGFDVATRETMIRRSDGNGGEQQWRPWFNYISVFLHWPECKDGFAPAVWWRDSLCEKIKYKCVGRPPLVLGLW